VSKKRIFTVGFDLPGEEFEHIEFDSDQTLLDADIVLYEPTLGWPSFEYGQEWAGKEILSQSSSYSTKARLDHWRAEIIAAIKAGKLVITYLAKPIEYYRFTGAQRFSGTGRSRVTTNLVDGISSYEAVPNIRKVLPKSGSAIRLEKSGAYLAPYWNEFSDCSPYQVEIEGEFNRVLLRSKAGDRVVGAAFHGRAGTLLFLPPLQYDKDTFLRPGDKSKNESEDDKYWTSVAIKFSKRLASALVNLADALSAATEATPAPEWTMRSNYRLQAENDLEQGISKCSTEITDLQTKKSPLEKELRAAGSLRALLFEQGKPLERSILEAMRLFGFNAHPFTGGDSEFDAIFASREGRCLGEAEGRDNKAINIDKFSQLERNLNEDFARDEITEYAKGVLFGNAYRLHPLEERGDFFTDKCISAAKRVGAALIRTPDLFGPAKFLKEHPTESDYAKACREAIFATKGAIVVFPETPETMTPTLIEASPEMAPKIEADVDEK
jgi:hypothetical protein